MDKNSPDNKLETSTLEETKNRESLRDYTNRLVDVMENRYIRGACALGGLALMITSNYSSGMDLQGAIGQGMFVFGGLRFMPGHIAQIEYKK